MSTQYRQGDLLFVYQETPPAEPLNVREKNIIVLGEVTGHAHRLTAGEVLEAPDGSLYLHLPYVAKVAHEEHNSITLEPGWWLVVRQREYSPETQIRTIVD